MKIYVNEFMLRPEEAVKVQQYDNNTDVIRFEFQRYAGPVDLVDYQVRLAINDLDFIVEGMGLARTYDDNTVSIHWSVNGVDTQEAVRRNAQISFLDEEGNAKYAEVFSFVVEKSIKPDGFVPPERKDVWDYYLTIYNGIKDETIEAMVATLNAKDEALHDIEESKTQAVSVIGNTERVAIDNIERKGKEILDRIPEIASLSETKSYLYGEE